MAQYILVLAKEESDLVAVVPDGWSVMTSTKRQFSALDTVYDNALIVDDPDAPQPGRVLVMQSGWLALARRTG